jgi:hypothetical protein
MRLLIATLAGAVTVFVWGGLSHLVLLEGVGFSRITNEERIVSALRTSLPGDGLYFLPSIDLRGTPSSEETAAWETRFRNGPTGLIVYHAAGDTPVSPKKILVQFLSGLFAAGIVTFVLYFTAAPYCGRVGLAALLGALGLFTVSTIYWNWYGFTNAFLLAQVVDLIVGWSLGWRSHCQLDSRPAGVEMKAMNMHTYVNFAGKCGEAFASTRNIWAERSR